MPSDDELAAELEAERAATAHWRRVARQRSTRFSELQQRPIVRLALGIERRLTPISEPAAAAVARARPRFEQLALAAGALGRRRPDPHRAGLAAELGRREVPEADGRGVTLIVVGATTPRPLIANGHAFPVEVDVLPAGEATVAGVRAAVDRAAHELVALVLSTSEPLDDTWLARLVAAVGDGVVAATPVLVHPVRDRAHATRDDGRVRAAGFALEASAEGIPVVRPIGAGTEVRPEGQITSVTAGSAAGLLVERAAYDEVGGLSAAAVDLEVAVVELCARLSASGGRVVVVPSAVVVDHRPVRSHRELRRPVDPCGAAWLEAIDRSGPLLLRSAPPRAGDPRRVVLTVAAPSGKVAARWGDWHLAEGLAGGLERLGHEVRIQTADQADAPSGRVCDVHVVLRGLEPVRRTPGQRHVIWIISHPESIEDGELDAADLVLVASRPFAEHLRTRTATRVEVLLQATDPRRFFPHPVDPAHRHAVTVVAKTRDVLRPVVADALAVGLRPAIYGGGWREFVDPSLIVADHVPNEELPVVYSSAGVVLNDHWATMQRWAFVSNRLFDVLACGTPVISDPVAGLDELFDGAVLEYHSPDELRQLVDEVLADPDAAHERAARGRAIVLGAHTFDERAEALLAALDRPGRAG